MIYHGARHYNPEVGRFDKSDSLFLREPERCFERPEECQLYSYVANNPLKWVDADGRKIEVDGNIAGSVYTALGTLGPKALQFWRMLDGSTEYIINVKDLNKKYGSSYWDKQAATIYWSPTLAIANLSCGPALPRLKKEDVLPPSIILMHELDHAYYDFSIVYSNAINKKGGNIPQNYSGAKEWSAVTRERIYAKESGYMERTSNVIQSNQSIVSVSETNYLHIRKVISNSLTIEPTEEEVMVIRPGGP
jgi:RHS repeat-associated protein